MSGDGEHDKHAVTAGGVGILPRLNTATTAKFTLAIELCRRAKARADEWLYDRGLYVVIISMILLIAGVFYFRLGNGHGWVTIGLLAGAGATYLLLREFFVTTKGIEAKICFAFAGIVLFVETFVLFRATFSVFR